LPGHELSISKGVVSRIEEQYCSYGGVDILTVQTDGAVNHGHSGSPVLNSENKVVGIAHQVQSSDADYAGEFIPVCVFINILENNDVCCGEVIPIPALGFESQPLDQVAAMRASLGLDELDGINTSGVFVKAVAKFGSIASALQIGDVVVAVQDAEGAWVSISNKGKVNMPSNPSLRVGLSQLFHTRRVGDTITVGIVRSGKRVDVEWVLGRLDSEKLAPHHEKNFSHGTGADPVRLSPRHHFVRLTLWFVLTPSRVAFITSLSGLLHHRWIGLYRS
jgi:S1-C subfamily serine protease